MALGSPYNIGSTAQASGVATTVVTAGTDANGDATTMPTAGDSLFVLIGMSSGVVSPSSVADSRGNTYTRAANGAFVGSSQGCWVYECLNPAFTLVSTNTVTVTWSATTAATSNVRVIGCSGVATSSADDQFGTGNGSSTSPAATAGGTLAQASELAIAVVQSGSATGGVTSWGTFGQMAHNLRSGSGSYFGVATLDTTSTTAPSASATLTTTGSWAMLLLTFKASTAGAGGLAITNTSPLPAGQVGVAYTDQLAATGGVPPYTWSYTGTLPPGLTLEPGGGTSGTGASADFGYIGVNTGPQGAPAISQFNACASTLGPFGYYKVFYSTGGPSALYSGYLGGDVNGGGTTGWTSGLEGALTTSVNGGPSMFIVVCWGVKMSAAAINNYCSNIPHNIKEVGFSFQSEPENAYPVSTTGGQTFVADWTDQANKIRAAQANTPVKLTLIVSSFEGHYGGADSLLVGNSSFIPPPSVVDVYGYDFYDRKNYWAGTDMSTNKAWTTWLGYVKGLGKPLALTEYGISGATAADQNTRLQADFSYLKAAFGPGGTASKLPLYCWLYWNTGGLSFSTTAPPSGTSSKNQLLSAAAQQTWQGIANTQSGQGSGSGGGGGGLLSGTPTSSAGSPYSFTVKATDSTGTFTTTAFTLSVGTPGALACTTDTPLPGATVGTPYNQILTATGGTTPYTWSLQSGTIPPGLSVSGGFVTGTPTTTGTYTPTIRVTDSAGSPAHVDTVFSITVSGGLAITTTSLPPAQVGVAYTTTLATSGGSPPMTWGLTSGSPPDGITLDQTAGTLSGTPTTAGLYPLTLQVTDSAGTADTQDVSWLVNPVSGGLPPIGRRRFGGDASFWVLAVVGGNLEASPNATVQFYSASTGGTQYTDLQTTGGAAIDSITTDAFGEGGEFYGPSGVMTMWADANGGQGPRRKIVANDLADLVGVLHDSFSGGLPGGSGGGTIFNNYTITGLAAAGLSVTDPAFGADPTGGLDSTVAIQSALNASPAGGAVFVPPGTYKVSSPLTIPLGVWLTGPLNYRAVSSSSKITCASTFSGASLIAFAAGTPCGGIRGLVLDGTSLPAGSVDGIDCVGACKQGSIVGVNVGHFTGHGINITASGGNPDGWELREISCHDNGGDGIHWDYAVDGQLDTFHLDHNTGSGLSLGTMNNCTFTNGKCQQNTAYGYTTTGGFVKSNSTLTACLSENNGQDGFHLNATTGGGQGSLQLVGCSTRDDGTSGASGSGYSGFWLNGKNCDITLAGCSNYVTTSTAGPDYGLTLAGCLGTVAILGGSYGGSVAAYHDGGSNTGTITWDRATQWTGQAGTRSGVTVVTTATGAAPAHFNPAQPTGTTSNGTVVMMGLGSTCKFTPVNTGKMLVTFTGMIGTSAGTTAAPLLGCRTGTGSAPANAAAATGTQWGTAADVTYSKSPAVGQYLQFTFSDVISGTAGTQQWFDLAVASDAGGGTVQVRSLGMTVTEA